MYYLRTKPAANALQFTVDKSKLKNKNVSAVGITNSVVEKKVENEEEMKMVCSRENGDACMMCSG